MSFGDKVNMEAKEAVGRFKEFLGNKTGDSDLEKEGREDRQEVKMQKAGEHAKEAGKNVADTFNP